MSFAAAIVQMTGRPGAAAENRAATVAQTEAAARSGARLIVLPELAVSGYTTDPDLLAATAEPLDGPSLAAWRAVAAEHDALIAGGFCERQGTALFNSAVLVGPDGPVLHYRKLHLFDAEQLVFTPGDLGLPVAETPLGRIGLCVCYDLRFVEVLRALALQDAEVVVVPTAWVGGFDPAPRDATGMIGQARGAAVQANLNQLFLLCASQAGAATGKRFLGSSMIVDPWGNLLAGPLGEEDQAIAQAVIDPALSRAAQRRSERIMPRRDRRTDVYALRIGDRLL